MKARRGGDELVGRWIEDGVDGIMKLGALEVGMDLGEELGWNWVGAVG